MKAFYLNFHEVILKDIRLSLLDRVIISIVSALDNEDGCWATNAYFAKFTNYRESSVSKSINKLHKLGYIIENKDICGRGYRRKVRADLKYNPATSLKHSRYPKIESLQPENQRQINKLNIRGNINHESIYNKYNLDKQNKIVENTMKKFCKHCKSIYEEKIKKPIEPEYEKDFSILCCLLYSDSINDFRLQSKTGQYRSLLKTFECFIKYNNNLDFAQISPTLLFRRGFKCNFSFRQEYKGIKNTAKK